MENPTNDYPEPRTDYIEARKVSMTTLEVKEVPLVQAESSVEDLEEAMEIALEKDYIPTSNLLQVHNVAYATREEEQQINPVLDVAEENKPMENKEHRLFYGAVMGGKAEVDRTMEEKTINKQC